MKDFILTYRTSEHYEVLGWVRARSLKEAERKARKELAQEIAKYSVFEVQVAEWIGEKPVFFKK
ncbi:MAG: hypothetical protein WC288_02950 [Candidatus Paceibacterota bacterium]|jgi:hypothetical protein